MADKKGIISVIVPVYNTEKYLAKCIDSIIVQTYRKLEIILIDDGSTDRSGRLCDELKEKDERIKVIHKENGGLSDARNAGIEQASGEYLAFIDSDDFIHPKMMEILCRNLVEKKADFSACSFWWEDEIHIEEKAIENRIDEKNMQCFEEEAVIRQLYENNLETVVAWNKLYKRELFTDIRYPYGKLHEDEFIVHKLLMQCKRTVYTKNRLYYYLRRDNSITALGSNLKRWENILEACEDRMKFWRELERDEDYRIACDLWAYWVITYYEQYRKESAEKSNEFISMLRIHIKKQKIYWARSLNADKKKKVFRIGYMPCLLGR